MHLPFFFSAVLHVFVLFISSWIYKHTAYCIDCACFCYSNKSVQFLCLSNLFFSFKISMYLNDLSNQQTWNQMRNIELQFFCEWTTRICCAHTHRENIGSIFANCCFAVRWNYDRLPMIELGQWFVSKCEALEEFQNNKLAACERRLHQKKLILLERLFSFIHFGSSALHT